MGLRSAVKSGCQAAELLDAVNDVATRRARRVDDQVALTTGSGAVAEGAFTGHAGRMGRPSASTTAWIFGGQAAAGMAHATMLVAPLFAAAPHTCSPPPDEPIVKRGSRAVPLGDVVRWAAGPEPPGDAIDHPPVVTTGYAVHPGGQKRLDDGPFLVGAFVTAPGNLLLVEVQSDQNQLASPIHEKWTSGAGCAAALPEDAAPG